MTFPTDLGVYIGIGGIVATIMLFLFLIHYSSGVDRIQIEREKTKQMAIERGFNPFPPCCCCEEDGEEDGDDDDKEDEAEESQGD